MKNKIKLWAALAFAICLIAAPCSSLAAIGDTTVGQWLDGNWLETYEAADGSKWGTWIDEGGTGAAGNETGDYWFYSLSLDGTGSYTFIWDYNVQSLTEKQTIHSNAATGFYSKEYLHDDKTGSARAYYKDESQWTDPLSGSYDNYLFWQQDLDLDGEYWDNDWQYESWSSYEAGRGVSESGWELYNWVGGIREYESSYTSISGTFWSDSDRYWDTDLDGDWFDNYYTQSSSSYDAEHGWENTSYLLEDRVNYDGMDYESVLSKNRFSGEMDSWDIHRIDTDADGDLGDYYDGGAYYARNSSNFDVYSNRSEAWYDVYDPFSHYQLTTYAHSYALTGEFHSWNELTVDTDGDGLYESGSNSDDYYYTESAGFDAGSQNSWSNSELWDIPNSYYYETSNGSNSGSGGFNNKWWYAADTDGDGEIENWYMSDDTYQYGRSGYWVEEDLTYSNSEISIDGNNKQDAYMWAIEKHGSSGNGDFYNEVEGANLTGYYRIWDGYDVGDTHEPGPLTYNNNMTKVWGQYSLEIRNWAFDAGDHGTWTQYNQDTDANTAWDKTDDYEIFNRSWDAYHGSDHNVGWYVDDRDTGNYTEFDEIFSGNGDLKYFNNVDGATGDEAEYLLVYQSGGTTPLSGTLVWNVGADDYEAIWFDGAFAMLPYPIGMEIDW